MSAAEGGDGGVGFETSKDREAWDELGNPEQQDTLVDAMQEKSLDGSEDDDVRNWDEIDDATQEDTLAAIEQSLDETWTAKAFEGLAEETTIPVEMVKLTEEQQAAVEDRITLIAQVEQAAEDVDAEDAEALKAELDDEAAELFENLDDFDAWADGFLAEITAGDALDREWWADRDNYPDGFRVEVVFATYHHYQDRTEGALSFRAERRRNRSR
ncbi:hypothetical protein [Halococcus saccharolyticus]|uniref:Uncharacterized protein n=1 Tax=Halococcus saccharolyticus DSM 5350 TaxID=1227455 RepID=M0MA42_9EURY|nr:hypothetical protein [Halococcus saccharolyticus]EMA42657.1 hypothetical protein C449_15983 [Halococcus saccharolyticus DSM 5350]